MKLSLSQMRRPRHIPSIALALLAAISSFAAPIVSAAEPISASEMQSIYDEVKTPFKYGVVLEPPPGKKIDCPNVFREGDKWFMIYVLLETDPQGYTTQIAESDDLLHWKPLGTIL